MSSQILINEIFPNPDSGEEWVELIFSPRVGQSSPPLLNNFTISDSAQVIYQFTGEEVWENNFLVIELSKLNNDQDSVILKDTSQNIIDKLSYQGSTKGKSWNRLNFESQELILGEISPGKTNFLPSQSPSPTSSPSPTNNPTPSLNSTPKPTTSPQVNKPLPVITPRIAELKELFPNYQKPQELKVHIEDRSYRQHHTRLAIIGQNPQKSAIISAIMGSSLLILATGLLFYDRRKKNK